MDEKVPEIKKPKAPRKKDTVQQVYLMDWKAAAEEIEAAIREAGWNSVKQRRNPRFLYGLLQKHMMKPLVTAVNKIPQEGE